MLERSPTHERAQGRWPEVLTVLGVSAPMLNTRKHHPCPWCGGKDRFRFTDQDGSGRFYCGQCGSKSPFDFVMKLNSWSFAEAAKKIDDVLGSAPKQTRPQQDDSARHRQDMKKLWKTTAAIERNDFVDRYLVSRGIVLSAFPDCLRKLSGLDHFDQAMRKTRHPALLAKVSAPNGEGVNLHRTYLTADGQKANVDQVRKLMAGGVAPGSAIRLADFTGGTIGIAEGIETAFSASVLFGVPVWSALNSSLLAGWEPPEGTESVIVFGDNDPKFGGQAAATALAHRLSVQKKLSVDVKIPPNAGDDWNDVLKSRRAAA